jgi:DNA (cytosine-5)-methyltransferase 1
MNILHGDCFAGAGGLAAGFRAGGVTTLFAIERDRWAAASYRLNHGHVRVLRRDIRTVSGSEAVRLLPLQASFRRPLDLLTATFPCECFSPADPRGRRPDDPRRWLCLEAVRLASACDARLILCENVPQFQDDEAHDRLLAALEEAGYANRWEGVLDSSDYGVPQVRRRWWLLASGDGSLTLRPPAPTSGGRPVTVRGALAGLPARAGSTEYGPDSSAYADLLRDRTLWRLDRDPGGVTRHVAPAHRDQFVERFSLVPPGSSVAEVFRRLDPAVLARLQASGVMPRRPFEERQVRLHPGRPAPTVLSSCTDQFVHPDVPRCLTLREVARLCGFSDGHGFHGSGFKQVGDCVPPPLALAWARTVREILGGGSEEPGPPPAPSSP